MNKIELEVNRDLLDPKFDGYKVSMESMVFDKKSLDDKTLIVNRSNDMISLQHMKIFSNDNQLFVDYSNCMDVLKHFYRITENGNIQRIIYNMENRTWIVENVVKIDLKEASNKYPLRMVFTNDHLVIVCDGVNRLFVYLAVSSDNWQSLLDYEVDDNCNGLSLIEARKIEDKLEIVAESVMNNTDTKSKFMTKLYWVTVSLSDIDFAEQLTVINCLKFDQSGHFETCTLDNNGQLIILSTEIPKIEGGKNLVVDNNSSGNVKRLWKQVNENIIVEFNMTEDVAQEDIKLNVSQKAVFLAVKNTILLEGTFHGRIDSESVEIGCDTKNKLLTVKLKTIDGKQWKELIEGESETITVKNEQDRSGFGQKREERVCGTDELSEECDESEPTLYLFWIDRNEQCVKAMCDVSCHQVLFVQRDCLNPANICIRHDVDGLIWSFDENTPKHLTTLNAFGYVQASKSQRIWTGCTSDYKYACIVESSNRVLMYSQKVAVEGNITNRKTSSIVTHVAKQTISRLDSNELIRGICLFESNMFILTDTAIHTAVIC